MKPSHDTTAVLDERQTESRLAEEEERLLERIARQMSMADADEEEDGR